MAVPIFTSGEVLTADDCNNWFTEIPTYKLTSTNRSSLSITIDPDLQMTLAASCVYKIEAGIIYQSTSAMRYAWTVPAGASGGFTADFNLAGTGAGSWGFTFSSTNDAAALGGSVNGVHLIGILQTSTTAGTFGFKWGSTSGPSSLTLGVGSILTARRVG